MNKSEIMNNISRTFYKVGFELKKHSPEILIVTGVVGTVVGTVMACKATTKLDPILEEAKEKIDGVHKVKEDPELAKKYEEKYGEAFTEQESKKELAIVYAQTGIKLVKLYAPAVTVSVASILCIVKSHNILTTRNAALAAAYTAVDKGFKEYRGRLIDRFGEDLDRELRYNIRSKEIQETVVDENGEEKVITKTVQVAESIEHNPYTKCFDEWCRGWNRDAEMNQVFLKRQQDYANEKLEAKGYLFLNEVYDMLGIPKTKLGHVVGWVYDENNPKKIDFGVYNIHKEANRDFVNGREKSVWLDFNPDGNIMDMIGYGPK